MYRGFMESHADYRTWLDGIKHTHKRRIRIRVLDLDHTRVGVLNDRVLVDGAVTFDVTRDVSRMLELHLLDREQSIGWEPDSAGAVSLHLHRMLQVFDERFIPDLGWVGCPVFTGPVTDFDRDGSLVTITADGKDRLLLANIGVSRTWAAKTKVVDVMRDLLLLAGESPSRIHLPDIPNTIPKRLSVTRTDTFLGRLKRLARSVDRVVFYDGRGHFVMRRAATSPGLRVGANVLVGPASFNRQMPDLKNRWVVLGPKPKGNKTRVTADIALPVAHKYSAQTLGRGTPVRPRYLLHEEEASVKTVAKARAIAGRRRDEQQRFTQEVAFDCLPFPQCEEHDLLTVADPATGTRSVRFRQATLPLADGPMSVGSVKRTVIVRKRTKKTGGKK